MPSEPMNDPAPQPAIVYHVRSVDPGAHLFEVSCWIGNPDANGQVFSLPAWIPGSYLVRDYARHVVCVEAEARGEAVPIHKLDKQTWRAAPVEGELVCKALVYAADRSVRGAWLDGRSAFFNGVCLFFLVHGQENVPCVLHVDPPEFRTQGEWRLATSLPRLTGTLYEWGAFRAENYSDLIDHPVLMGNLRTVEFEVAGVPHVLAIEGRHEVDEERLKRDLARLCQWHVGLFGAPPPMDRYWFLLRAAGEGYGGLEHRFSSALLARRDDLPTIGRTGVDAAYRRFLGLVSHEYFHLWHVKRIKPAEFVEADLSRGAYTRQLWFSGHHLLLRRSGTGPADSFRWVIIWSCWARR